MPRSEGVNSGPFCFANVGVFSLYAYLNVFTALSVVLPDASLWWSVCLMVNVWRLPPLLLSALYRG